MTTARLRRRVVRRSTITKSCSAVGLGINGKSQASRLPKQRPTLLNLANLIWTSRQVDRLSKRISYACSHNRKQPHVVATGSHKQHTGLAITMGQPSKFKRELEAERRAYAATSEELDEALQVAQYLALKVESLRSVIATLAMGTELKIGLHGYSEDLEEMERM